jgi:hypothetical protein
MRSPSEFTPLIGISVKAATMLFSLEYDASVMAQSGPAAMEDSYHALLDSRMALVEYISELESRCDITPNTFYRRD